MSKYIKREHILAEIDYAEGLPCGSPIAAYEIAKAIIEDAPTVDAVSVVRCKDCIYRGWCFGRILIGDKLFTVDYCSYGKKETDHE